MSLPSNPVMVSVEWPTPSIAGRPATNALNSASDSASVAARYASCSSRGEARPTGGGGVAFSRPCGARAAIMRGSLRGSEPKSIMGSPNRPGGGVAIPDVVVIAAPLVELAALRFVDLPVPHRFPAHAEQIGRAHV